MDKPATKQTTTPNNVKPIVTAKGTTTNVKPPPTTTKTETSTIPSWLRTDVKTVKVGTWAGVVNDAKNGIIYRVPTDDEMRAQQSKAQTQQNAAAANAKRLADIGSQ